MTEKKIDEILGGNYDGIQEYDNDLPRWWLVLFYITIGFALVYTVYVHFMHTPTDHEVLAQQLASLEKVKQAYEVGEGNAEPSEEVLLAAAKDPQKVEAGKGVFVAKCVACHGQKAEGLVGPNLTDEFWIHGGKISQIHEVIEKGVPEKGMLSWKALISQPEIENLTAYIWSIRNTNVPGKAPQGDKVP